MLAAVQFLAVLLGKPVHACMPEAAVAILLSGSHGLDVSETHWPKPSVAPISISCSRVKVIVTSQKNTGNKSGALF